MLALSLPFKAKFVQSTYYCLHFHLLFIWKATVIWNLEIILLIPIKLFFRVASDCHVANSIWPYLSLVLISTEPPSLTFLLFWFSWHHFLLLFHTFSYSALFFDQTEGGSVFSLLLSWSTYDISWVVFHQIHCFSFHIGPSVPNLC